MVISGFLGLDSLKEESNGTSFSDSISKLIAKGVETVQDPFLVIFGEKFLKKGWRQFDRDLLCLIS